MTVEDQVLSSAQWIFAETVFHNRLATELHGTRFQEFFQDLMSRRYPDFIDIRSYGNLGDQGADGLRLDARELFACYGAFRFDAAAVRRKFRGDVSSALRQRGTEFDTFVFVHNDLEGMHPQIASLLSVAATQHAPCRFRPMGRRHLWHEIEQLDRRGVEACIGREIPIQQQVYGIGIRHLKPLLEHLGELRIVTSPRPADDAYLDKISYNLLNSNSQFKLTQGEIYMPLVGDFYGMHVSPIEAQEVADGFKAKYQQLCRDQPDLTPDERLVRLEHYVQGNELQTLEQQLASWTVLAYFFFRCHIFESPGSDHEEEDG